MLPVQLTWRGVQIYFPSVVLSQKVRDKGDEALRKLVERESKANKSQSEDEQEPDAVISGNEANNADEDAGSFTSSRVEPQPGTSRESAKINSQPKRKSWKGREHQCPVCRAFFTNGYLLKRHSTTHSATSDKSRRFGPCVCGARFTTQGNLSRHQGICLVFKESQTSSSDADTTHLAPVYMNDDSDDDSSFEEVAHVKVESESILSSPTKTNEIYSLNEEISMSPKLECQKAGESDIEMEAEADLDDADNSLPTSHSSNSDNDEDDITADSEHPSECLEANQTTEDHSTSDLVLTKVTSGSLDAFKCQHCGLQFGNQSDCQRHVGICFRMTQPVSRTGKLRKFKCTYCPWKFIKETQLRKHIRTHTGEKPFQCEICLETFARTEYLRRHTNLRMCPSSSIFKIEKSTFKSILCPSCPRMFSAQSYLIQHAKTHLQASAMQGILKSVSDPSTQVKCDHCLQPFTARRYLKQHLHHCVNRPGQRQLNICPYCADSFANSGNLHRHIRNMHKCSKCGEDFPDFSYKEDHIEKCDARLPENSEILNNFPCPTCKLMFIVTDLIRHVNSHSDYPNPILQTSQASDQSKPAVTASSSRTASTGSISDRPSASAVNSVHSTPTPTLKCDLCGEIFSDKIQLSRHCLIHAMGKDFPNNFLPLLSSSSVTPTPQSRANLVPSLSFPIPTADGDPVLATPSIFTCKFKTCMHFFSHDEDLWYHVDKKHKMVGNICCGQCGKDFESEQEVNRHEDTVHATKESQLLSTLAPAPPNDTIRQTEVQPSAQTSVHIQPPAPAPVEVICKKEVAEESHFDHFDDADDTHNLSDTEMFVPKTELIERIETHLKEKQPNPYVIITAECKAAADAALESLRKRQKQRKEEDNNINVEDIPYEDYYTCERCYDLRTFFNRDEYINHLLEHKRKPGRTLSTTNKRTGRPCLSNDIPWMDVYTCKLCNRTFTDRKGYRCHLFYHKTSGQRDTSKPYKPQGQGQRRHDIPVMDVYTCQMCTTEIVTFTNRKAYIRHLNQHENTGRMDLGRKKPRGIRRDDIPVMDVYTCQLCTSETRTFTDRRAYFCHLNYHNATGRRDVSTRRGVTRGDIPVMDVYTCQSCISVTRTFTDRRTYIIHLGYHRRQAKRQGDEMATGPTGPSGRALRRVDIPLQDTYECTICEEKRTFTIRREYISHINYHEISRKKSLKSNKHRRPLGISSALENSVPFSESYSCEICTDRTFTNRYSYLGHVMYHKMLEKKGCNRVIMTKDEWMKRNEAYKTEIPEMDTYACEICNDDRTFANRQSYISHMMYHERLKKNGCHRPLRKRREPWRKDTFEKIIPMQDEYRCETCTNRTFTDRKTYILHLRYHEKLRKLGQDRAILSKEEMHKSRESINDRIPEQDSYTCDICNGSRTFSNRQSYISHLMYHDRLKKNGCHRPVRKRWEPWRTTSFENAIPIQDEYRCETCTSRTFTDRKTYILHLMYHEKLKKLGQDRAILSREEMYKNRESMKDQIPDQDSYTCDMCNDGRTFTNKQSYISHYLYHQRLKKLGLNRPLRKRRSFTREDIPFTEIYTCARCEEHKTFTNRTQFINHSNYHDILEKKKREGNKRRRVRMEIPLQSVYRCKLCTNVVKTFTDRQKYKIHLHYHKMKQKSYTAVMNSGLLHNPKATTSQEANTINMDVEAESDPSVTRYTCRICGEDKVFTNEIRFKKHMKYHSIMKNKEFQCKICEKAFASMWNLSMHAKVHTGEKTYHCGDCGKRFRSNQGLQKHQNESCKKVPCKYTCHCGDKFHAIEILERHVKRYHSEESSSPSAPSNEPVKVLHCYVCSAEFHQTFELDDHVRENHPIDYEEFMREKEALNPPEPDPTDDMEPIYPEVIMSLAEPEYAGSPDAEIVEADNISQNETAEGSETQGNWNFIAALAGGSENEEEDDDSSQGEEYCSEFMTESFEPEDVEVQGNIQSSKGLDRRASVEFIPSPNQSSNSNSSNYTPTTRRNYSMTNYQVTNNTQAGQTGSARKQKKPKRVFQDNGRYRCGYCDKTSHRVHYLKVHFTRIHSGLPFKYHDISSSSPKKSTQNSSSNRRSYGETQPPAPPPPLPIIASLQPHPQPPPLPTIPNPQLQQQPPSVSISSRTVQRTSSTDSDPGASKGPKCACVLEDSALGYLKRCTGEGCACYSNTKGCSKHCGCDTQCSNPYFRAKAPPQPLPDLISITVRAPVQNQVSVGLSGPSNPTIPTTFQSIPVLSTQHPVNPVTTSQPATTTAPHTLYYLPPSAPQPQRPPPSYVQSQQSQRPRLIQPNNIVATPLTYAQIQQLAIRSHLMSNNNIPMTFRPISNIYMVSQSQPPALTNHVDVPVNSVPNMGIGIQPPSLPPQNQNTSDPTTRNRMLRELLDKEPSPMNGHQTTQPPQFVPAVDDSAEKVFRCFCYQDFSSLSSFLTHQWVHRDEKIFVCPICRKQLESVGSLILHARVHTDYGEVPLSCVACDSLCVDKEALNVHFTTCHPELICKMCQRYCQSIVELKAHMQEHGYRDLCGLCGYPFPSAHALRIHLARDHGQSQGSNIPVEVGGTTPSPGSTPNVSSSMGGGRNNKTPEVITLVDLDEFVDNRPPSPTGPVIVSVASGFNQ